MNQKKTGELIRSLRKERGLTQQQLACRMSISDKTVSKWERAQVRRICPCSRCCRNSSVWRSTFFCREN